MPLSGCTRLCPPPQLQTLVSFQFANFNKISGQVEELAKDVELVFLNNTRNSGWVDGLVEVTGRHWVVTSLKESNSTWMNKSFILPQIKLSLKEKLSLSHLHSECFSKTLIFWCLLWWKGASPVVQMVKNPPANTGDAGLIPGSGRSPGEMNGYPLQYSCLENPMDRRAWQVTVHGVAKRHDWATKTFIFQGGKSQFSAGVSAGWTDGPWAQQPVAFLQEVSTLTSVGQLTQPSGGQGGPWLNVLLRDHHTFPTAGSQKCYIYLYKKKKKQCLYTEIYLHKDNS